MHCREVRKAYKPLTKKDKKKGATAADSDYGVATTTSSGPKDEGLSIEETNKLRAEMGLKPLRQ